MAHRSFVDDGGVSWNVWDVRPQWVDRRHGGDRRTLTTDDQLDPPVLELRRNPDRRKPDSGAQRRVKLADGFSGGWLTFECSTGRRRLSPIPDDWETVPPDQLAALCSRATAPRTRPDSAVPPNLTPPR